jgi:hypothetical protein
VPLIEVHLARTTFIDHREEISEALHAAQIEVLGIPADDRFQIYTPHEADELVFDDGYNDVDRQALVAIRVTAVHMYSTATKKLFYQSVVKHLEPIGIRPQDVLISLVENGFDDWYAGRT